MIEHVLLAVDDSLDSLAAARLAVELAGELHAHLRAVHVSARYPLAIAERTNLTHDEPSKGADGSFLRRVAAIATTAGVEVDTELLDGDVAASILNAARLWPADLIIIGKSARALTGEPYVGAQTRGVLEFAELPVLVVPPTSQR